MKIKSNKIITLSILLFSVFYFHNTFALDYQTSTNVEFTFNPVISVSVSGDLTISELPPGSTQDSNIINVNVSTNNISGYNLSATTGSSTNATTNLTHANNTNTFTSLSPSNSCATLDATCDNEHPNLWGYSYSTNNGTDWSNYSGLPLYTSTGTTLSEKYLPTEDSIKFKIAARAGNTQIAGNYTNTINFTAVANPEVRYYMHEFTNELCSTLANDNNYTVYDIRDGNDYTVRYINGACWMTQNLRITGTISSQYSNFTGPDVNISEKDLDEAVGDCSGEGCDSYTVPMTHKSNNEEYGVWYNFCATTAKAESGCKASTAYISDTDICPIDWHLPTYLDYSSIRTAGLSSIFNQVFNGFYVHGLLTSTEKSALWWSSTAYENDNSKIYTCYHNKGDTVYLSSNSKIFGFSVRCVRTS